MEQAKIPKPLDWTVPLWTELYTSGLNCTYILGHWKLTYNFAFSYGEHVLIISVQIMVLLWILLYRDPFDVFLQLFLMWDV